MGRVIDLTGQKFGKLTVLKSYGNDKWGERMWICNCECGNQTIVRSSDLRYGTTKSCGCYARGLIGERSKKYNTYDLSGEYGIGYTSKGEEFYFDLEDYDKIKGYCWFIARGYVRSHNSKKNKDAPKMIHMHRLVMSAPNGIFVDHIHSERRNDNRKSNLRFVDISENGMNKKISDYNKSGVIGVSYCKERDKWVSSITYRNKQYKKRFKNFEDAVAQRKKWEEEFFGEYSYNNSQKQII